MKAKTIKAILKKLHTEFVASIKDEKVRELVKKNSVITGGSIVSLLLNEKVNDYDYYFTNKETTEAVARYYVAEFNQNNNKNAGVELVGENKERVRIMIKSAGIASESGTNPYEYFEQMEDVTMAGEYVDAAEKVLKEEAEDDKPKYRPIFLSDNAISLSGKIQLVIRFYGSPEDIHTNYDFVHAMSYWTSKDDELVLPAKALEAILTKELIYFGSKYPLASIIRTRKFIQRGWSVNAGQYLKMILQLSELDLTNIEVLTDQLVGMDAAYFAQVLHKLREKQEADSNFKLTTTYLLEVVDRMF